MRTTGTNIKESRQNKGRSQRYLAQLAHLAPEDIERIERMPPHRKVDGTALTAIATALGVTVASLVVEPPLRNTSPQEELDMDALDEMMRSFGMK